MKPKHWHITAGQIKRTRLCAGPEFQNKGICSGDSGGPLVCHDGSGSWHQAGIASFTSGTKPGQVPAVYTKVSEYRSWIETIFKVYN
ncbi:hypothetical protein LSH36_1032g00001 [Paralvinella palmiformis]|uniref:Peptidase S1 domain-containing protein n=1 Tax=Paralvinella palmiformis TaxID=53620 RepID=A0AAD9MRV5_9ANNE|nr:hypothetical protein LSH36_1032g00001 [Paralvinella palmiformis]